MRAARCSSLFCLCLSLLWLFSTVAASSTSRKFHFLTSFHSPALIGMILRFDQPHGIHGFKSSFIHPIDGHANNIEIILFPLKPYESYESHFWNHINPAWIDESDWNHMKSYMDWEIPWPPLNPVDSAQAAAGECSTAPAAPRRPTSPRGRVSALLRAAAWTSPRHLPWLKEQRSSSKGKLQVWLIGIPLLDSCHLQYIYIYRDIDIYIYRYIDIYIYLSIYIYMYWC